MGVIPGDGGIGRFCPVQPIAHQLAQDGQLYGLAVLVVGHGIIRCHDGRALGLPVSVAQPAVVLAAGIDHMGDRLISDGADYLMQLLGGLPACTCVDQDRAVLRHHKAEGRVVAQVFRVALGQRADDGIDVFGHLFDAQNLRKGGMAQKGQ